MSSKIPAILAALTERLNTVAPTYRALEGRALTQDAVARLPVLVLRLTQDQLVNAIARTSVVTLNITIEAVISADVAQPDAELAELIYAIRAALMDADETPPLCGLVLGNGITWEAATYNYPDSGDPYLMAQQPLVLKFSEHYRGS